MKQRRLDPIFQTKHKEAVIVDGKVIGEIYTLPKTERQGTTKDPRGNGST